MAKIGLNLEQMDTIFDELYRGQLDPFAQIGEDYGLLGSLKEIANITAGSNMQDVVNKTISKLTNLNGDLQNNYYKIRDFMFGQIYEYRAIKNEFSQQMSSVLNELSAVDEELQSYLSSASNTNVGGTPTAISEAATATNTAATSIVSNAVKLG